MDGTQRTATPPDALHSPQIAGKSLEDSGLLLLSGVRLIRISRHGQPLFTAAPPAAGPRAGLVSRIGSLFASFNGGATAAAAAAEGAAIARRASGVGVAPGVGHSSLSPGSDSAVVVDMPSEEKGAVEGSGVVLAPNDVLHFQVCD